MSGADSTPSNGTRLVEERRARSALFKIDLITAAWQWPRELTLRVVGRTEADIRAFRNGERDLDEDMIDLAKTLECVHYWIWTLPFWPAPVSEFWRRTIDFGPPIGKLTPLTLVSAQGRDGLIPIANLGKEWRSM